MVLGQAGRPSARFGLGIGAWLTLVYLAVSVTGAAAAEQGAFIEAFGPDGTSGTVFESPAALAVDPGTGVVYVGDSRTQTLYKFDASGAPLDWGGTEAYISGNEITGLSIDEGGPGRAQVAVDPNSHIVYLTTANSVRAFEPNGEPHEFTALGGSELSGATQIAGVAVDKFGNIYTSDLAAGGERIRIYEPSGELLMEFEPIGSKLSSIGPGNLAVAPDGTLYATDVTKTGAAYAFEPSIFPLTDKTTYSLGQPLNDEVSRSVAVDPVTQFAYVGEYCPIDECGFETVSRIAVYAENGDLVDRIAAPGELKGAVAGIGLSGVTKKVYAAVFGEVGGLSQVSVFQALSFHEGPPRVVGPSATDLTSTSAVLRARINPNTKETTYWFEYGLTDCAASPDACTRVPSDPTSIGSGHNLIPVSASLSGLTPGTKYFYRVVAENSFDVTEVPQGGSRSFTTPIGQFGLRLSDSRVWELVTPPQKFGGAILNAALLQAAADGSGIAFHTRGSIVEDPEGNRAVEPAAALARRSGSGWKVSDLVPRHTEAGGLGFGPEFKLFSTDLGKALLEPRDDTPLSPEASERGPYLRTNTNPPSYRPLVTSKEGFANVEPGVVFGGEATGEQNPVAISGANASLTHVILSSKAALVPGAEERSLYLWSDGALEVVSELPPGEASPGVKAVTAEPGSGVLSVRHAISEDGSRVFWGPGTRRGSHLDWDALYLRDTMADETVRLDKAETGASEAGVVAPAFMTANADGSVVFFTDSQQLTEDASPDGRDLYRCEIGDVGGSLGCVDLEDLSAPLPGSGENGEAEELAVGISDHGNSIYFVARGVLDPEPNEAGEPAVSGSPNLYFWQKGSGVRFIAPLSENDAPDWGSGGTVVVAQASRGAGNSSSNGRYLTFMSERNLAGAETSDPETGEPVEQAFLYDSIEDKLVCISCNPSGTTDAGHRIVEHTSEGGVLLPDRQKLWEGRLVGATLPETTEGEITVGLSLYWPRGVLDSGRAYFNSFSPLVNGDSNGTWDVYQYEPFGVGDCQPSVGSRMVAATETGCVSLMSAGTDSLPSVFLDASASGDDVFLGTFARLSALDTDTEADIYDARVGGVEAVVNQPTECSGEACQQRGLPPDESAPNSSSFNGAGNVKGKPRKHCKKGQRKVKRHGKVKCVKAKKHKKQNKSAQTGRGA